MPHDYNPHPHRATDPDEETVRLSANRDCDLCPQERRIRDLEKLVSSQGIRLHEGDLAMRDFKNAVEKLLDVVVRVEKRLDAYDAKASQMNPWVQKFLETLLQWGLPIVLMALLWAVVKSGQVVVP
jgi:hypothetical protein